MNFPIIQGWDTWTRISVLVVAILIFLLIREIVCWYWKLNDIVSNLESINEKLASLIKSRGLENTVALPVQEAAAAQEKKE